MRQLVIGLGEVGTALREVLSCEGRDREPLKNNEHYDVLHICFPFTDHFVVDVRTYKSLYNPRLTIIHSTVPVGTSRMESAVHSPVHGVHPHLVHGLRTFIKYIGAERREDAELALRLFQEKGIKGYIVQNPETSELSKLGCTTRHGLMIMEQKLFKKRCDEVGADFEEAYTQWNGHYSEGYRVLGLPYVQRPIIKDMPGKIGGHCILRNAQLIGGPVADFVIKENDNL